MCFLPKFVAEYINGILDTNEYGNESIQVTKANLSKIESISLGDNNDKYIRGKINLDFDLSLSLDFSAIKSLGKFWF